MSEGAATPDAGGPPGPPPSDEAPDPLELSTPVPEADAFDPEATLPPDFDPDATLAPDFDPEAALPPTDEPPAPEVEEPAFDPEATLPPPEGGFDLAALRAEVDSTETAILAFQQGVDAIDSLREDVTVAGQALGSSRLETGVADPLRVATPAPPPNEFSLEYNTLVDVREHLATDEHREQQEALNRTLARARRRVETLRDQGHQVGELEARLLAARMMADKNEPRSALLLVEEVLVLAKVMSEFGIIEVEPPVKPVTREEVHGLLDQEIDALHVRFQRELSESGEDLRAANRARLESRLADLLSEERFRTAAASAAAARPQELLDRPETVARIDAIASRLDLSLILSSRFFERVDALVRERLDRLVESGGLEAVVDALVRRQLTDLAARAVEDRVTRVLEDRLADLQTAEERVDQAVEEQVAATFQRVMSDEAFLAGLDARAREAVREDAELRARVAASPELRARIEEHLRESEALAEAVVDGVSSDACGELIDKRIEQQVERQVEQRIHEQRADMPTDPGVAVRDVSALVDRQVAKALEEALAGQTQVLPVPEVPAGADAGGGDLDVDQVVDIVQQQMMDKSFRKAVDQRVEELTHRGVIASRIQEAVRRQMRESLAKDPALVETIQEQVKSFLVAQVKKKKKKKKTGA